MRASIGFCVSLSVITAVLAGGCGGAPDALEKGPSAFPAAVELRPGPGQRIFRGSGSAAGTDEHATDQAVRQAVLAAVEHALDEGFPELRHDRLHGVVRNRVLGSAGELAARHLVTAEETREGFRAASVVAAVDVDALAEMVRSAQKDLAGRKFPRILVAIGLDGDADSDEAEIARRTIEAEFARRGARLLDHADEATSKAASSALAAFLEGDDEAAHRAGSEVGAEVVIVGALNRAGWALKGLAEGGAAICRKDAEGLMEPEALIGELGEIGGEMAEQVFEEWSPPEGLASVSVHIANIGFEDFARLRRAVERVRGVAEVSAKPFGGEAGVFRVSYNGSAVDLAESLGALAGFRLRVVSVQPGAIDLIVGLEP